MSDRDQVIKNIQIEARVPLDRDTIELRNLAMAEASAGYDALKEEAKAAAKLAAGELKKKYELVKKLREAVLTGSELGMVDGFERWDYDRFEVDTVRKDTGEVTNTRPMSAEERTAYKEPPLSLDLGEPTAAPNGEQKLVLKRGLKGKADAAKGAH